MCVSAEYVGSGRSTRGRGCIFIGNKDVWVWAPVRFFFGGGGGFAGGLGVAEGFAEGLACDAALDTVGKRPAFASSVCKNSSSSASNSYSCCCAVLGGGGTPAGVADELEAPEDEAKGDV